jgi:hypothetical protein
VPKFQFGYRQCFNHFFAGQGLARYLLQRDLSAGPWPGLLHQRNIPGSIECQRGETVRGAAVRVRIGVGRVAAAGTVLTVSFSCSALVWTLTRGLGQTLGSSPFVLAAAKTGLAISSSKNR